MSRQPYASYNGKYNPVKQIWVNNSGTYAPAKGAWKNENGTWVQYWPPNPVNAQILAVAGGGSGGTSSGYEGGGGGGAGGVVFSSISLDSTVSYPLAVGAGGPAGTNTNGSDTFFNFYPFMFFGVT